MLTVIKRDGRTEPFSADKIEATLLSVGDESGAPMNRSDIKIIISDMLRILDEKTSVRSQDIYIVLLGILTASGYGSVAKAYRSNAKNAWRK